MRIFLSQLRRAGVAALLLGLAACDDAAETGPGRDGGVVADAAADVASDVAPGAGAYIHVHVGGGTSIHSFRADLATGVLSPLGSIPAGDDARLVEVDPRSRRVYVQSQLGNPLVILTFDRQADGMLKPAGEHLLPYPNVEGMTQMGLHPAAPWMMLSATNAFPGLEDVLMPVAADGRLGQPRTVAQEFYAFAWDPSGRFFYGLDGEAIFQFRFDVAAGGIIASDPAQADGSSGRVVLALRNHPNGRWVYSVEERELGQYGFDLASGLLTNRQFVQNPIVTDAIYWTAIALHPEGTFLYALGYLDESRLALVDLFRIDPADGHLTFVKREKGPARHQVENRGLQSPLVLRELLLVGGPGVATDWGERPLVSVYKIAAGDGTLTAVGEPTPLTQPGAAVNFIFAE